MRTCSLLSIIYLLSLLPADAVVETAPVAVDPVVTGSDETSNDGGIDAGGDSVDASTPVTAPRSSGSGGLGAGAIVGMSLGGLVLIAAAAVVQRRRRGSTDDAVSGIDSSAMPASDGV